MGQQLMGSKGDECSGETCVKSASIVSVNDDAPYDKILKFDTEQKSEIRNPDSGYSNNPSENVCSEVSLRNSGSSTASQDVVLPKLEEPKGKGCADDDMSCVTGSEDAKLSDFSVSNGVRTDLPSNAAYDGTSTPPENGKILCHRTSSACEDMKSVVDQSQNNQSRQNKNSDDSSDQVPVTVSLPTELSLQNSGLAEDMQENAADDICLLNAKGGSSHTPCEKFVVCNPNLEETEENLRSRFKGAAEVQREHLSLLSVKEAIPDVVHSDMTVDAVQVTDKAVGSCLSPGANGNSGKTHAMDESNDPDLLEDDVKVCDICGDAGREDLLAVCCRCSDGAEHTYCMREMLTELPKGDWFCEECRSDVEIKDQKQDKVGSADGKGTSGQVKAENQNSPSKSEAKGSSAEENNGSKDSSGVKISAKRHIEDVEVSSVAKKRVLDPNVGPTKTSVSNGGVALSRDSSFKHLDKGKIKPSQQSSCTTAIPGSDSAASSSRLQAFQGSFIKSNSFNSLNVKPKVKLVDDVVPQKQRSVRESIPLNKKEGAARPIGKSMSFRYTNSSRLDGSETKVKMLSSKFPSIQEDVKGSKYTKDQSLFERKNSFNVERGSVSSPMATSTAKKDKRLASCGEAGLLPSVRNHRDMKSLQSDNKSMTFSRSSSFAVRKGSEIPVSLGEVRKQSSELANLGRVSATNGTSSDMEPKPGSSKEDSSPSSCIVDQPPSGASEGLLDESWRRKESTSFSERGKESSVCRSKQNSGSGRTLACQKCNEFGHLTQCCPTDCPALPPSDASTAKSSREITEGKDKLKAAIEAAVLRKPGISRKQRVSDQADDTVSSLGSEIAPQDHLLVSINRSNASAAEEMPEGQLIRENSSVDSCKQATVDSLNQSGIQHIEASTSRTDDACQDMTGLSLIRNVSGHVPSAMSCLFRTFAIPDYDYIWKGNFGVYRKGKTLKFCDGIQAHLSSCASPKVLQAVNKFPRKLLLNEVARLSTWPRQFEEYGVKEDNIALFFFAKDLSSYEKGYKTLLDNMMKYDLALKGNLDDVELMIFPSNHLPEKSQRWNTLFFLWGVFRGRRTDCSEHVFSSQKQMHLAQEIPAAIMSLPENISSPRPADKDLSDCGELAPAPETIMEKQIHQVDSSSFLAVKGSIRISCEEMETSISREEMRHTSTSLEGGMKQANPERGVHTSGETTTRAGGFDKCEQITNDEDSSLNGRHFLHRLDESKADGPRSLSEGNMSDKIITSRCQVDLEQGSILDSPPPDTVDQIVNDNNKRQHVETVERILVASASTSQVILGDRADDESVNEVHASKRQKTDPRGMYGGNDKTSSPTEGSMSGIHNEASSSRVQADCRVEGSDGTDVRAFDKNAERYFFPVDINKAVEIDINKAVEIDINKDVESSIPWKLNPLEDNRIPDKAPNLELALFDSNLLSPSIPTILVGKEEKKVIQDHFSHEGTTKGGEDDESALLSLSLSFPFFG